MSAPTSVPLLGYAMGYCTRPVEAMRESAKTGRCFYCGNPTLGEYATHSDGGIVFWSCLECFDKMPPVTDLIERQNFNLDGIGVAITDYVNWREMPYSGSFFELVTWRCSDGRFRDLYRFSPTNTNIDYFSHVVLYLIPDGFGWELRKIDYDGRKQDITTINRSCVKPFAENVEVI